MTKFQESKRDSAPSWAPDWTRIHEGRPFSGSPEQPLPLPKRASKWTPDREDQFPKGIDFKNLPKGHQALPRWYQVMFPDGRGGYELWWITGAALVRSKLACYCGKVHQETDSDRARRQFEGSSNA